MTGAPGFRPRVAMVLAAGRGTRLGPASELVPKPLVSVGGRALLDHALDLLAAAGVRRAVVNTHYRAELIEAHLARRTTPEISISREAVLLDTGGGVKNALDLLGEPVFLVANSDLVWDADAERVVTRLARAWSPETMDVLLLLHPAAKAFGHDGLGDFFCDPIGRVQSRPERQVAPFLYTGVQVMHRRAFDGAPDGPFPMRRVWDRAEKAGRLFAIVHDGEWLDAGTPRRLAHARARFGELEQGRLL